MIEAINKIFSKEQVQQAQHLLNSLSLEQKFWLSGYLTGVNQSGGLLGEDIAVKNDQVERLVDIQQHAGNQPEITVLFGTHTGNSRLIAENAAEQLKDAGAKVNLVSMPDYNSRKLKEESNLLVVVSTHGEGEPPISAEDFYSYIFGKKAPKLDHLNFGIIGLGDSSYINFCKTGNDIHKQLVQLGAKSVHDIIELDIDFKDHIGAIIPKIVTQFSNGSSAKDAVNKSVNTEVKANADQWVEVEVLDKVLLNGRGSNKATYHIELDIEDSGISYEPGDALEVISKNNPVLVDGILNKLGFDPEAKLQLQDVEWSLKDALIAYYEITVVTPPVIKKYAEIAQNSKLSKLIDNPEELKKYLYGSDFLDLINDYPVELTIEDFQNILRKLPARLYSISSSFQYNPDEVHITVGAVKYNLNDREHQGVCSGFLAEEVQVGDELLVRIKKNEGFRLPEDHDAKVIMVGPGTGIAPFRAFLQEREALKAKGENWIFFGDQHFESDFLYQAELLKYRKNGLLKEISVAFSRDQEEKIYVQHRLRENGAQIYQWIKEGAYFYLCGDMNRMAKDVKKELVNIIAEHGNISVREAADYFKEVKSSRRFQEDVY